MDLCAYRPPIQLPRRPVLDWPREAAEGREMTGEQCREARERLAWNSRKIAVVLGSGMLASPSPTQEQVAMVKEIISRKIYDTDTATRLYYREGRGGNAYQGLYQTPEGSFFLWEYDEDSGDIKPKTDEEAYEWLKEHASYLLEQYFRGRAGKSRLTVELPANLVRRLRELATEKSLPLNSYLMRSLKQCASASAPMVVRTRPKWLIILNNEILFDDEATDVPETIRKIMNEVYTAFHNSCRRLVAMGLRATLEQVMVDKVNDHGSFKDNLDEMEKAGYLTTRQRMDLDTILQSGHATIHRGWEPTDDQITTIFGITENLVERIYIHAPRAERLARAVPPRPSRAKKT